MARTFGGVSGHRRQPGSEPREQFGTHIGLLGTSGRYGYFWLHIWAGRGFEPVRRRCPETPPKVRAIHGATSGGPNSELIKALKKFAPPP